MLSKVLYKKPKKMRVVGFYRMLTKSGDYRWFVRIQDDYGIFKKELNEDRLEELCKKANS